MRQKLLTIQEASEFLGVSSKTLRRWEERGLLIPLRTTGNQRRFSLNQLKDFRKLGKKNTSLKVSNITSESPSPLTLASMISTNPQPQKSFEKGGVDEAEKPRAYESKKWFERLYEILEIKNIRSTIHVSHIQKSLLFGAVGLLVLVFLGVMTTKVVLPTSSGLLSFVFQNPNQKFSEEGLSGDDLKAVLGVADAETLFNFNIPVLLKDEVEVEKNLTVLGTATLSGNLTAPNVLYSTTPGLGITTTNQQASNSGVLAIGDATGRISLGSGITLSGQTLSSSADAFKTVKVGSTTFSASGGDTLTFSAGSNISLSTDTTNKKLTITGSSSGTIGGSGTAGTLAKFSASTTLADSLISESSTTISVGSATTITGGSLTSMTTSSTFTFAAAATTLNIGPTGSGASSMLLSGGSSDTGCTIDGSTGALTCAGAISSSATSGTQGYWSRSGTTLTPATATDTINTTGNITFSGTLNTNTFSSTALTFAGTDPVIAGPTGGSNTISLNSGASGSVLLAGGSGSTGCTIADATGNLTCSGSISSTGGSDTGFWSRNSGTSTLSPVTTGDHISTTGNISSTGTGTITSAGLLTGQAGITITGATTSLNASSNFATNINTGTSTGTIGIGNSAAGAITMASGATSSFTVTNGNISLITASATGANGVINLTSALASGNTTTSAFNITTSTDLGATDEVLQIGDSAATFLTVRGDGGVGIGDVSPDGLLDLDTAATSGTIFGITSTGVQTTGDIVNIVADSLTDADVVDISAAGMTTGVGVRGAFNGLTSGSAVSLSSSATAFTGTMVGITLSGSNSANTGTLLKVSNSGTLSANTAFMVTNLGTGVAFRVNDETGDTDSDPFVVAANGSVGIGSASPNADLYITGDADGDTKLELTLDGNANNSFPIIELNGKTASGYYASILFNDAGAEEAELMLQDNNPNYTGAADSDFVIASKASSKALHFVTDNAGTESIKMTIEGTGDVGIGATSPGAMLEIASTDAYNDDALYINAEESTVTQSVFAIESDTTGNGQSADTVKAHFEADGSLFISLTGTQVGTAVCHATDGQSNNDELVDCTGTLSDYAERYPITPGIEYGDIVIAGDTYVYDKSGTKVPEMVKSQKPYQQVIGITSDNYSDFSSIGDNYDTSIRVLPVALVGRIPVKVTLENGPIRKGDYLTTSSSPGKAMKAMRPGPVIGTALNDYNGPGDGTVVVFVKATWADPLDFFANVSLDANGNLVSTVNGNETSFVNGLRPSSPTNDTGIVTDQTATQSASLPPSPFTLENDPLFTSLQQTVTDLQQKIDLLESQLISNATSSASLLSSIASASATLSISSSAVPTFNSQLSTLNSSPSASLADLDVQAATVSGNLIVSGRTLLNDLGVTGKIQTGLLTIDGLNNEINTLAGDLKLQSSKLAGIDILNGTVTIDTNGNITTLGTIKAKELQTEKLTITTQSASNSAALSASAGVVTIPVGQTSIDVDTTALTDNSLLFITSEQPIPVGSKKKDNDTFTISVQTPPVSDLKVNWWIVDRR